MKALRKTAFWIFFGIVTFIIYLIIGAFSGLKISTALGFSDIPNRADVQWLSFLAVFSILGVVGSVVSFTAFRKGVKSSFKKSLFVLLPLTALLAISAFSGFKGNEIRSLQANQRADIDGVISLLEDISIEHSFAESGISNGRVRISHSFIVRNNTGRNLNMIVAKGRVSIDQMGQRLGCEHHQRFLPTFFSDGRPNLNSAQLGVEYGVFAGRDPDKNYGQFFQLDGPFTDGSSEQVNIVYDFVDDGCFLPYEHGGLSFLITPVYTE